MIQQPGDLSYFISEKEVPSHKATLLLISLAGPMNRSNAATFDKLIEEVAKKSPSWVIINMRDLGRTIERTQFPAFARLQKVIREKPAELKLCSIHPGLKTTLQDAGLVRHNELADNLSDALASLTPLAPKE